MAQTISELGTTVVVVVGKGFGASLCRRFAEVGHPIAIAASDAKRLTPLVHEIENAGGSAMAFNADATEEVGDRASHNNIVGKPQPRTLDW